jgi:hypothetical protein
MDERKPAYRSITFHRHMIDKKLCSNTYEEPRLHHQTAMILLFRTPLAVERRNPPLIVTEKCRKLITTFTTRKESVHVAAEEQTASKLFVGRKSSAAPVCGYVRAHDCAAGFASHKPQRGSSSLHDQRVCVCVCVQCVFVEVRNSRS